MESAAEGPLVVGIGGTARPGSTTDRALRIGLEAARGAGARTMCFGGHFIAGLPTYEPQSPIRTPDTRRLLQALRSADGVLVASPGYHGGVSGVVKNAIDLLEDTRGDERAYFDGMPVGLIVSAAGWQAGGVTLAALRGIVHAMRGWPTPVGIAINSIEQKPFAPDGSLKDESVACAVELQAKQIMSFRLAEAA